MKNIADTPQEVFEQRLRTVSGQAVLQEINEFRRAGSKLRNRIQTVLMEDGVPEKAATAWAKREVSGYANDTTQDGMHTARMARFRN